MNKNIRDHCHRKRSKRHLPTSPTVNWQGVAISSLFFFLFSLLELIIIFTRQLAAEEESGNSLSSFQDQMDEDQAMMRAIKESRREIEEQERRALREQQEREFQETLLMDQLKEQEKENKRKQEEACKEEVSRLRALLPDDVTIEHAKAEQAKSAGVGRCICALVVRLPDGSRLERRFWGDSTLLDVKHFVDLYLLERQQAAVAGEAREGPDPSRPGPWEHYYFATSLPQKKFTNWYTNVDVSL